MGTNTSTVGGNSVQQAVQGRDSAPLYPVFDSSGNFIGFRQPDGDVFAVARDYLVDSAGMRHNSPLRGSLVAALSVGSDSAWSFARAPGPSTVIDHEGRMHFCLDGEARFRGLRRVANLIADTYALTTGWTLDGATTRTQATGGGARLDRASGSGNIITLNSAAYEPGKHIFRCRLYTLSGSLTVRMRMERSGDSATVFQRDVTVTTTPTEFSAAGVITDTSNHRLFLTVTAAGAASFYVQFPQLQRKDTASNNNPDDWVARGYPGAALPFDGAGVDGVKYFDYLNQWVVNEDTGTVYQDPTKVYISDDVAKGLMRSGQSVNSVQQGRDLSNAAWTATATGTAVKSLFDNLIGYGAFWFVPETTANSEHGLAQSWQGTLPPDSSTVAVSVYAKRGIGRDWAWIGLRDKDGATRHKVFVNLLTGQLGAMTGGVTFREVVIEDTGVGGVYRIGFSYPAGVGASAPQISFGTAQADGIDSFVGAADYGHYWAAPQMERTDHPTSLVALTTTTTLTRPAETVQLTLTGMLPSNDFTIGLDFTPMYHTGSKQKTGFQYIGYAQIDGNNRFGTVLRPGRRGGNVQDAEADDWAQDTYCNTPSFDGVNITQGLELVPRQTVRHWSGQASEPARQDGFASGSFMVVGGRIAYKTVTATPTLGSLPSIPTVLQLGQNGLSQGTAHEACYRDFQVFGRMLDMDEMVSSSDLVVV